jgi:O-antigen ligase
MGALAALGFVLCARVAGDGTRPDRLRAAGAGAAVPLALGVYLSFSRGALAGLAVGLAVLLVLAPDWRQLRAAALTVAGGVVAALVAQALPGVRALEGGSREKEGLVALAVLLLAAAAAGAVQLRSARRERAGSARSGRLLAARHTAVVAAGLAVLVLGGAALSTALERGPNPVSPATGATAKRLTSTESNRYAYWRVALGEFADHPLEGIGSGGFRVAWLKERKITDPAQDAHSLYVETAAELGLVGLILLALFLGGIAAALRRAYRTAPGAVAGLAAGTAVWALHAALDWDWEMPAVTLPALALAGALIALADPPSG